MNRYELQLTRIAEEIDIRGAGEFHHAARGTVRVPERGDLTGFLSTFIYLKYFVEDGEELTRLLSGIRDGTALWEDEDAALADGIIARLGGRGYACEGFEVTALADDHAEVSAGTFRLRAPLTALRWTGRLRVHGQVTVIFPPYRRYLQRGRLLVIGDACTGGPRPEDVVRCYLRPDPSQVAAFAGALAEGLNTAEIRFQMKLATRVPGYARTDAVVVYVPVSQWSGSRAPLEAVCDRFAHVLTGTGPCFALPLRTGWAVAVDRARPGAGSFGQRRCLLVARGLVEAWERGENTAELRRERVRSLMRREGIDPGRPYLEPGLGLPGSLAASAELMGRAGSSAPRTA